MYGIDDLLNDDDKAVDKFLDENTGKNINESLREMAIGYIDINGLQYMMKTMDGPEFQKLCNRIAEVVESIIDENKSYLQEPQISKDVKFHMFSDNMIFLCDDLQFLIERMGLIQRTLAVRLRLTIKGGIDKGSVYYYKDRFILGKGLVSAYKIDRDYHNPAIKISRHLVPNGLRGIIKVGFDEYVVDYYRIAATLSEDFWIEEIPHIKKMIEDNLAIAKSFPDDVLHKYFWLKEYHNTICKKENMGNWLIK